MLSPMHPILMLSWFEDDEDTTGCAWLINTAWVRSKRNWIILRVGFLSGMRQKRQKKTAVKLDVKLEAKIFGGRDLEIF